MRESFRTGSMPGRCTCPRAAWRGRWAPGNRRTKPHGARRPCRRLRDCPGATSSTMFARVKAADPAARAGALPAVELTDQVRREQVRILYEQLPYSITGTAIAVVFLAALMWDIASRNAIVGWVLCMAANQLWRAALYFRFRRHGIDSPDVERWAQYWAAGSLISGCLWGAASFLFFVPDSPAHQAFLIVLLFGVVAAAVLLIGIHMPSFYGFVVPALVPIVLRNLIEGGAAHYVLAFVATVTTLAILSFGRNYNRTLMESLRNRFENEA